MRYPRIQGRYTMLEPCEAKVSSTVLRAGDGSNPVSLTRRIIMATGYRQYLAFPD